MALFWPREFGGLRLIFDQSDKPDAYMFDYLTKVVSCNIHVKSIVMVLWTLLFAPDAVAVHTDW